MLHNEIWHVVSCLAGQTLEQLACFEDMVKDV